MNVSFDFNELLRNRESWKYLDFGKKTELNIYARSYFLPNIFPTDTVKEFISGRYMEHPMLNELQFMTIDKRYISSIIEVCR